MNATKCPSPTIRVYLLSDYLILASALIQLIDKGAPLFELCGGAIGCEEALEDPGLSIADVVLIDMETGGDVARDIIPRLSKISDAKVLLLTRMNDLDAQDRAVLAGARGVIRQNTPPDLLLTALAKVHEGQMWLDREATSRIFVEFSRRNSGKKPLQGNERHKAMLTSREEKVIACIVENGEATGKVIADKLHISESTLRNHLTSIYSKLGISNRVGLLNYAQKNGLGK